MKPFIRASDLSEAEMERYEVVPGGVGDVELLTSHRLNMWKDIQPELATVIDSSEEYTRQWIADKITSGRLFPFIARSTGGKIAGSGCILLRETQPRPSSSMREIPYLLSMYTEKHARRQGVATMITMAAVDWCRKQGYDRVVLHASREGRRVYEKLGFESSNEMRLRL